MFPLIGRLLVMAALVVLAAPNFALNQTRSCRCNEGPNGALIFSLAWDVPRRGAGSLAICPRAFKYLFHPI